MSEENQSLSEEVRLMLDERGIEWKSETNCDTYWYGQDRTFYKFTEYSDGTTSFSTCQWNLTPKQVLTTPIAATVGRSCASCPEADNPDSYISHLQSALKWHDEHVPRPTNPRNTCVVLKGEMPPEEVMFVREDGGVTHYLPEGACHMRLAYEEEDADGCIWPDHYECDACGAKVNGIMPFCDTEIPPKYCPNCRARVVSE